MNYVTPIIWKNIPGYEGLYMASTEGDIKSLNYCGRGYSKILKPRTCKGGYKQVALYRNHTCENALVHKLIMMTFKPHRNEGETDINHRNELKSDNRVLNLEYCSRSYNCLYGTKRERTRLKQVNHNKSKRVIQLSLDGEIINIYPSTQEVQRSLGFKQSNISSCCLNKIKTAYGYIWRYKENE